MNKYKTLKLVQLIVLIIIAVASVSLVILDRDLYFRVSQDAATMIVCIILWILFIFSFIFLYFDFRNLGLITNNMKAMSFALEADQLSGLANKSGIDALIAKYSHSELPSDLFCITFSLTNIERVNSSEGQTAGNQLIKAFSDILKESAGPEFFLGRNGGSKFIAVATTSDENAADNFLAAVENRILTYNSGAPSRSIEYSTGTARPGDGVSTMQKLIAMSDRRSTMKGGDNEEA